MVQNLQHMQVRHMDADSMLEFHYNNLSVNNASDYVEIYVRHDYGTLIKMSRNLDSYYIWCSFKVFTGIKLKLRRTNYGKSIN